MTTPFSLLRLPRLALIPVFQQMEPIDLIAFSLLSNQTMRLSKFFRLKTQDIWLRLEANNIEIVVFLTCGRQLRLQYFFENSRVVWRIERKEIVWHKVGGLSMIECIYRIIKVTHCDFISVLIVAEIPQYDVFPLLALLPTISEVLVSNDTPATLVLRVLRVVLSKTSKLNLFPTNQLTKMGKFQELLIVNLDIITISGEINVPFTLDDLLITNAVKIRLNEPTLNEKDLNRFFQAVDEK
ncbi:hypothetical protein CRE_25958 [Caenorhabditis remanei]|uniref:F-box domain-containing protein n=1 Tax=Caenorhabditis remanei TaxID=31234 RepID=E3NM29_CAERE|nr:hypothetical protein CRE_25958 [Caenorhabditis remanei]